MSKDICSGKSPWPCDEKTTAAYFNLKERGIDPGSDPLTLWRSVAALEWEQLMNDDEEDGNNDRMKITV